jgi:predicted dehydrogenase
MQEIRWGIIGCGDVTEVKSGPAFNKVRGSQLVAVMRRDADKAADYARRHGVPKWYNNGDELINDPEINAIYIATPPSTHEAYTLKAIAAGKPVYVEKPMTVNTASAERMARAAEEKGIKLVVAHYRREQPFFKKIKDLLRDKAVGNIRLAQLQFYRKPLTAEDLQTEKTAWRINAAIAGGGLFHDMAPHQLDLMYYFFGEVEKAAGIAINTARLYAAADTVAGSILFKSGVLFNGAWCFAVAPEEEKDICELTGTEGSIRFPVFGEHQLQVVKNGRTEIVCFDPPQHVQQPMIQKVVDYFLDKGPNPCPAEEGVAVMQLLDAFTSP